ncbi:NAD(P)-binding protein [Thozetella sp. PMI_491]|nr:NAD(P)-binding protein [Thozetella sp. PMI_491]
MATYLITQATGQQSQAVIAHLLAAGAKIHAVVRDLQKVPPLLQNNPNIVLFKGESVNFEQIVTAAQGCKGAFLNTYPIPGLEAQQAQTVADACKKAGVESIVLSTTFKTGDRAIWDDEETKGIQLHDYFSSKAAAEDAVRSAGLKAYTILRPAFIHIDYLVPSADHNFPALSKKGELEHSYNDGARMPQTDVQDVGAYAAAALQDPAKFGGQEIDLDNESLTIEEVRDILAKVSGREVRLRKRSPEEIESLKPTFFAQRFHLWANSKPLTGAPDEVQAKFGIPFTSLEAALQRDKARLLECIPA